MGAAEMKLETDEVGPLGGSGNMAHERGHQVFTSSDGLPLFEGK